MHMLSEHTDACVLCNNTTIPAASIIPLLCKGMQ
jgi:hypothetical protein